MTCRILRASRTPARVTRRRAHPAAGRQPGVTLLPPAGVRVPAAVSRVPARPAHGVTRRRAVS